MPTSPLLSTLEHAHRAIDAGLLAYIRSFNAKAPEPASALDATAELRRHIYFEEAHLFPVLQGAGLAAEVFVAIRDHGELWYCAQDLDARLAGGKVGDRRAFKACRHLAEVLQRHNVREEPRLYRPLGQLDEATLAELGRRLEGEAMPEEWACARAPRGSLAALG